MWGAGLFALGGFADCVGLTGALSAAVPRRGERAPVHDRGAVLVHALLTVAAGGEACSDVEHLRAQRELFGGVALDSALWRVITGLGAAAQVRPQMWADADRSGALVVDVGSTLAGGPLGEQGGRGAAAALRSRTSPTSPISQAGRPARGSWCAESPATPARSAACSRARTSAAGDSSPTKPATRPGSAA